MPDFFGNIGARAIDIDDDDLSHEITLGARTYRLGGGVYKKGDFSSIHIGEAIRNGKTTKVLIKLSSSADNNLKLEREQRIHEHFQTEPRLVKVGKFIPKAIDTFDLPPSDDVDFRRRVIVYPLDRDYVSVARIIDAFPDGMDPQDAAWVARRVLAQAIAAKMAGLVHGSIVPDHVLVNKKTHDPLHIGWSHAVDPRTERFTSIISRWRDYYPPEVFNKQRPDERTDVFMAGKTLVQLLGGDVSTNELPSTVPEEIALVVKKCVQKSADRRYESGREAFDALTNAVRNLWGKKYRELDI